MELYGKLKEVCRLFQIGDTFLGFETIQMGNITRPIR